MPFAWRTLIDPSVPSVALAFDPVDVEAEEEEDPALLLELPPELLPEPLLPFPPPLPLPPPLPPPPPLPLPPPLPPPLPFPLLPSFASACFALRTRREPSRLIVTGDAATTKATAAQPPNLKKPRFETVNAIALFIRSSPFLRSLDAWEFSPF